MKRIDLNCDLGESFGNYTIGMDEKVLQYITSANVACGFHASDPLVMSKTVAMAKKEGVAVGAHPGFPDLVGFGRRNMNVSFDEAKAMVTYQIGALNGFCQKNKMKLQHVKPHGALYNMAVKDEILAKAICEAIYGVDKNLILLAPYGSKMASVGKEMGLQVAMEVFADRAYEPDGSLVARTKEGAMITDEEIAIKRVLRMILEGKVKAIDGTDIEIQADSVCVHGDSKSALNFVEKLSQAFYDNLITMEAIGN